MSTFDVIAEIEPAVRPDLMRVRHQIGVLSSVASGFLIPDNHIGRATVSSIAVAHEVALMGGRAIACLNARDRNGLGFRRDLLTAAAYGVTELLFVYGDRPESGRRSDDLTVRSMIDEARRFGEHHGITLSVGAATTQQAVPQWKGAADFLFAQVSFSVDELCRWRASVAFDGPVYAGVLVVASSSMGRTLSRNVPQLAIPESVLDRVDHERDGGVTVACELVCALRDSQLFDGVHLIPVGRYREVARRLEIELR